MERPHNSGGQVDERLTEFIKHRARAAIPTFDGKMMSPV
jgi:hypothetical protein